MISRAAVTTILALQLLVPLSATSGATPEGERRWLALGDSYSSGEGIPGTTREPDPSGKDCSRANGYIDENENPSDAKAYAIHAFEVAESTFGFSSLQFVACTGAVTGDVEKQIEEASVGGAGGWDIVTLSFGGNDIGFPDIIKECLDVNGWGVLDPSPGCDRSFERIRSDIDRLVADNGPLPSLYGRVAQEVRSGGDVVVVGYPQLVEEVSRWDSWRRNILRNCEGIRASDVSMLRQAGDYLNESIRAAVGRANDKFEVARIRFHYLDLTRVLYEPNATERHGLCSKEPWLNGRSSGASSGDIQLERSFHPNSIAHSATGAAIARMFGSVISFDDGIVAPEPGEYALNRVIRAGPSFSITLSRIELAESSLSAEIVYRNIGTSPLRLTCRGLGDPSITYLTVDDITINANRTFCSDNPSLDFTLDPGESSVSYGEYPYGTADLGSGFSLTWYPGSPVEGITLSR